MEEYKARRKPGSLRRMRWDGCFSAGCGITELPLTKASAVPFRARLCFRRKSPENPPSISTQLAHARNTVRNELHRTPLDKTSTTHFVSISVAYKLMLLLWFNQGGV
jgi:hypothetical protein